MLWIFQGNDSDSQSQPIPMAKSIIAPINTTLFTNPKTLKNIVAIIVIIVAAENAFGAEYNLSATKVTTNMIINHINPKYPPVTLEA